MNLSAFCDDQPKQPKALLLTMFAKPEMENLPLAVLKEIRRALSVQKTFR